MLGGLYIQWLVSELTLDNLRVIIVLDALSGEGLRGVNMGSFPPAALAPPFPLITPGLSAPYTLVPGRNAPLRADVQRPTVFGSGVQVSLPRHA